MNGFLMLEIIQRSFFFARLDVKRQFKMSILGPVWAVVSTIVISTIIFTVLSGLSLSKSGYSDLVIGLHIWACSSGFISESMHAFVSSSGLMRNTRLSVGEIYSRFFVSQIMKMLITCSLIGIYTFVYNSDPDSGIAICLFPIVFSPVLFFLGVNFAIVGSRFRDLPSLVTIILQVLFYATPILWATSMLPISPFWNQFNVFYHFISCVRDPHLIDFIYSVGIWTATFAMIYLLVLRRFTNKVVYWV